MAQNTGRTMWPKSSYESRQNIHLDNIPKSEDTEDDFIPNQDDNQHSPGNYSSLVTKREIKSYPSHDYLRNSMNNSDLYSGNSSVDSGTHFSPNSMDSTANSPTDDHPQNLSFQNGSDVDLSSPSSYCDTNNVRVGSERQKFTFESEQHHSPNTYSSTPLNMSQRRSPREYLPNPVHAASERRPLEEYLPNPVHADSERRQYDRLYTQPEGSLGRPFSNFDESADDEDQWVNDEDNGGEDRRDKTYRCGWSLSTLAEERRSLAERSCQKQEFSSSKVCAELGLKDVPMNLTEVDFQNLKTKQIFHQCIMPLLVSENPLVSDYKLNMLSSAKWHEFSALIPEQDSEDEPDPDLGPTQYLDLVLGRDDQDQDQTLMEQNEEKNLSESKDGSQTSPDAEVHEWGYGSKPATLKCNMCGYTCIHYNKLKQHIMEHTGEKPYTCPNCDYKCKNKADMKVHMCKHSGEKPFECILCDYKAQQVGSLNIHMLTHQNEEPYTCKICRKTFKTECALSKHEPVHSDNPLYSCTQCDYKNPNRDDLQRHMQFHANLDNKPLLCNYCDFKCMHIASFSKHMKTHISDRLFKCPDCDYRCSQIDSLNAHMLTHTGEKPFMCNECPYSCRTSSSLKVHIMRHGENAPYTCTECGYKAISNHALINHMRKHTGERPFSCTECNYTCALKHSLKIHMGKHTQPFRCPHCSYRCAQKGSLKLHLKKHDPNLEEDSALLKPQKRVIFNGSHQRSKQIRVIPELMQIQSEHTHTLSDNTQIQIQTYRQLHFSPHTAEHPKLVSPSQPPSSPIQEQTSSYS